MKKWIAGLLSIFLFVHSMAVAAVASETAGDEVQPTVAADAAGLSVEAPAAVLMEAQTGKVLFAKEADAPMAPASVTKVMTLLLVEEALAEGKIAVSDPVTVSEYAASMGGSQVFLEAGEQFSVDELIKCTVIASANDAAVALAEYVGGSEEAFVAQMNARAEEMHLLGTHFENVTGLDDDTVDHTMSAGAIAEISRRLCGYPALMKYAGTWMDSIRDGAFTLTNTNRLIRFYPGATGLKTGSTSKAHFCLAATACRGGMTLVAVVMGAETRDARNAEAMKMLDWGFANYSLYSQPPSSHGEIKVCRGSCHTVALCSEAFSALVKKGEKDKVKMEVILPGEITAPVTRGQVVGKCVFSLGGEVVGEADILAESDVPELTFGELLEKLWLTFFHLT